MLMANVLREASNVGAVGYTNVARAGEQRARRLAGFYSAGINGEMGTLPLKRGSKRG
jgi:hypothetical protein